MSEQTKPMTLAEIRERLDEILYGCDCRCSRCSCHRVGRLMANIDAAIAREQAQARGEACEHGAYDDEYCDLCNAEYKRARIENGGSDT